MRNVSLYRMYTFIDHVQHISAEILYKIEHVHHVFVEIVYKTNHEQHIHVYVKIRVQHISVDIVITKA